MNIPGRCHHCNRGVFCDGWCSFCGKRPEGDSGPRLLAGDAARALTTSGKLTSEGLRFVLEGRQRPFTMCDEGHLQEVHLSAWKDRRKAPPGQCGVVLRRGTDGTHTLCLAPIEGSDKPLSGTGCHTPKTEAAKALVRGPGRPRKSLTARRESKRQYQRDYMRCKRASTKPSLG